MKRQTIGTPNTRAQVGTRGDKRIHVEDAKRHLQMPTWMVRFMCGTCGAGRVRHAKVCRIVLAVNAKALAYGRGRHVFLEDDVAARHRGHHQHERDGVHAGHLLHLMGQGWG